jgi:hypothetical protein
LGDVKVRGKERIVSLYLGSGWVIVGEKHGFEREERLGFFVEVLFVLSLFGLFVIDEVMDVVVIISILLLELFVCGIFDVVID